MEQYPRNLVEFEQQFTDECACREYLSRLRWPNGFACPRCGAQRAWSTDRGLFVCRDCHAQVSVTAGTLFQDSHKPLMLWFRAIWMMTSQKTGASALSVQRVLGFGSYETAWAWLHKLRRAMVRPGRDKLSGRVEVDECYWGGETEGVRGRHLGGKTVVAVAAEEAGRGIGRIRLARLAGVSAASLESFVTGAVLPGSVVHTDGWRGYSRLDGIGYSHEVNAIRGRKRLAGQLLPRTHRVVSLLKRWLAATHQGAISHEHLDYYLDEFTFRFNRRTSRSRGKLFYRLVQQAAKTAPVPYAQLVKGVPGRGPRRPQNHG